MRTESRGRRLALFAVAAGSFVVAVAVKDVIRPAAGADVSWWARLLLGSTPSFFSAMAVPLWFLAARPAPRARDVRSACRWAAVIALAAELVELRLPGSTFDWADVAAALLGIAAAAALSLVWFRAVDIRGDIATARTRIL